MTHEFYLPYQLVCTWKCSSRFLFLHRINSYKHYNIVLPICHLSKTWNLEEHGKTSAKSH